MKRRRLRWTGTALAAGLTALGLSAAPASGSGVPPACPDGNATMEASTQLQVVLLCSDPESDPLTYTVVRAPAQGPFLVDQNLPDRLIGRYVPAPGDAAQPAFVGTDSYGYQASDGTSLSNTATNTVQVLPVGGVKPHAGVDALAQVVSGIVRFRAPGASGFVEVNGRTLIPFGSVVDVTAGRVRLTTETVGGKKGGSQSGEFYDGIFKLSQKKGDSLVTLKLTGGDFSGCPGGKPASRSAGPAAAGGKGNGLWGEAKGKYKTGGRRSSTTVRGTTWFTQDRCDGTLTKVRKGRVEVRDFVRRKTIQLKAGQSYLARAKR